MDWMEGMHRAIAHVEEHLTEDIDPDDVARQAYASTYHFMRTFNILTGFSLGEYIRNRRLTLAAMELAGGGARVTEVALKYGYETPEAFSRAFQRQHGISPSAAREPGSVMRMFNRLSIQVILKGEKEMNVRFVDKEAFKVHGMKRAFTCENGQNMREIPKFWQEVMSNGSLDTLLEACDDEMGVMGICGEMRGSNFDYWIAGPCGKGVPAGMETLEIPATSWAVFESIGPMPDAIQAVWGRIFSEWLPNSGYEHAKGPELEVYAPDDSSQADYRSWVWIPVTRK